MIIQCTNCKARFKIPDSRAKKEEFKARCAKCEQIFVAKVGVNVFPEASLPDEPKTESKTSVKEEPRNQDVFASTLFDSKELSIEEPKVLPQKTPGKTQKSVEELIAEEFPEGDTSEMAGKAGAAVKEEKPLSEKFVQPKLSAPLKSPRITAQKPDSIGLRLKILLYPLVVAMSLFGGLIYAGLNFPFRDASLLFSKNPNAINRGTTFTEIRSEFVDTVAGRIFLISGRVFNNSPRPLAGMKILAELYSERNLFLKKEEFPCCASFEKKLLHGIRDFGSLGIMYRKDSQTEIKPYEDLPFMLVFGKPDDSIRSFRINVVNE